MRSQPKCFWPCLGAWEKGAGAASSQPEIEGGENRSYLQNLCQMNTNKYLNNIATLSPLSSTPRFWTIFGREHHTTRSPDGTTCSIHITLGARNFPTTKSASGPRTAANRKKRAQASRTLAALKASAANAHAEVPTTFLFDASRQRKRQTQVLLTGPPRGHFAVERTPSTRRRAQEGTARVALVRLVKNPFGEDRAWCSFVWSFGGFPLWYKGNPSYPHKATPPGERG